MSKIGNLIQKHKASLRGDQVAVLLNLDKRHTDGNAYAWTSTDAEAHCGFVKVERIFSSDPVSLFGQDAPSLAHNRMTVYRSDPDSPDGNHEVLMSMLVSEQSLTRLMLSSNRGSNNIPATAEVLSGVTLPKFTETKSHHDTAFDAGKVESLGRLDDQLEVLTESLSKGGSVAARGKAMDALNRFSRIVSGKGEIEFYLGVRGETYSAKRVDLVSEAAHAALHADRILGAEPLLIGQDEQILQYDARQESPILDAVLDHWTSLETTVMGELLELEISEIADRHGLNVEDVYSEKGTLITGRDFRGPEEAKEEFENISSLANEAFNQHVIEGREKHTAHGLGMSITQMQGHTGFLHSSLPATGGSYFTISIGAAYKDGAFGEGKIRGDHSSIMEFSMTSDDLMMMFRGHPTGVPTPCTLKNIAGRSQHPPEADEHVIKSQIKDITRSMNLDPRMVKLQNTLEELQAAMMIKGGGKEWSTNTDRLTEQLKGDMSRFKEAILDTFSDGDDMLRAAVGKHVAAELSVMSEALPSELMHKLMLTSPEDDVLDMSGP
jgi:hypothetical protein